MKIQCLYSEKYERFLEETVKYIIARWGNELDLSGLEIIELKESDKYQLNSEGRTYNKGKNILLSSEAYDQLDELAIEKVADSEKFKSIVNTIYHEMVHASDWKKMPQLYGMVEDNSESSLRIASLFWLEYLAEKRSNEKGLVNHNSFCEDFVTREWKAYKINFNDINTENFIYLCKALPYFMGRSTEPEKRTTYLAIMKNRLLKEMIVELDHEIKVLEAQYPFDDPEKLNDLYNILNQYCKKFKRAFRP